MKRTVRCWFGNKCTIPFCHFEHSGWIARKVSRGVNTNRRDWDPHHARKGRGQNSNYFDALRKKGAARTVQRPVAGVYRGDPGPRGSIHSRQIEDLPQFLQRVGATRRPIDRKAATGGSTYRGSSPCGTRGAEAGPSRRTHNTRPRPAGTRGAEAGPTQRRHTTQDRERADNRNGMSQRRQAAPGWGRQSHSAQK